MMRHVGYEFLRTRLPVTALAPRRPARIMPVTRIERLADCIAVPPRVAPTTDDPLEHILFALKHEGVRLDILAQALPQLPPARLEAELAKAPNGQYIRKAAFLWEHLTGQHLVQRERPQTALVPLFDPKLYIVGPSRQNHRWRVDFNGLGSLDYCAAVERTPAIEQLLASDVLGRTRAFIASLPEAMMDRAMTWAYLHETQGSFAIEREAPSQDKAQRFIQLLRQAHERMSLSEAYLCELQSSVVTSPLDRAMAFRHEQNHLHSGLRGAAGVSYLPPPPELCRTLISELMSFANSRPANVPPMILATVISFGFVFLHPFMDGNGRLSRFLIHHTLCAMGELERGALLPISIAMKKREQDYLQALRSFSREIRNFWRVEWIDDQQFDFEFVGHPAIYRYWDATSCAELLLTMAEQALEIELRQETRFLANYDRLVKAMDQRFDIRGSDLSQLVILCLDQGGRVSNNRRRQYAGRVPEAAFDALEQLAAELLAEQAP